MSNNPTKTLAQGAMMIALFTILVAISFFAPIISIVAALFAPLPIAWYSAKVERNRSILVTVVAIILPFFIGGLLILPMSLIFATIGFVIGDALRLKKSKLYLYLSTSITLLITFAIQYVISLRLFEFDVIKDSMKLMRETYEKSNAFSKEVTGQATFSKEDLAEMFSMVEMTIPASITLGVLGFAFVIITVNLPLLRRFGIEAPKFAAFKNLRLSKAVLWYYLITLTINLFIRPEFGSNLYMVTLNLSVILWVLLTIQGISFMHFTIDAFRLPPFIKVMGTVLAIPLYSFVVLLGIIDLGFNIRNYVEDKTQKMGS